MAVVGIQQTLDPFQIVGVLLLLLRSIKPQFPQHLIFNSGGIGHRGQLLFSAVLKDPGGVIHVAGAQRRGAAVQQAGEGRHRQTAALGGGTAGAELVGGAGE
ncbi:hypothetical protein D3C78_1733950 [compost metagenome]